jgi:hypothetical protein
LDALTFSDAESVDHGNDGVNSVHPLQLHGENFLTERYVLENRNDITPPIQMSDYRFRTDHRSQENGNDRTRHIQPSGENIRTDCRWRENRNDIMLSRSQTELTLRRHLESNTKFISLASP